MSWAVVALATGLATTVGALPFLWFQVSRRFYDTLLGFGAGLMLAAATLGLLTTALESTRSGDAVDLGQLAVVLGGFCAGVALLYTMDRLIPHEHAGGHGRHVHDDHVHPTGEHRNAHAQDHAHAHDHEHDHGHAGHDHGHNPAARKQGLLIVGVMALHRLPEGFAIGAAYATERGAALGLTLAIAIAVQNAVEGAVMAAPLRRGGLRPSALLGLVITTGMSVPAAALVGHVLSLRAGGLLAPLLAMAAGALIYLTCNEVIPESHSHGNERRATFGIVAGFAFVMVLQVLTGHHH